MDFSVPVTSTAPEHEQLQVSATGRIYEGSCIHLQADTLLNSTWSELWLSDSSSAVRAPADDLKCSHLSRI